VNEEVKGREATAEEWEELGRRIEARVKQALGSWAGAEPDDDWEAIGRKMEIRIRAEAAKAVGAEPEADWEAIGEKIEAGIKAKLREWLEE